MQCQSNTKPWYKFNTKSAYKQYEFCKHKCKCGRLKIYKHVSRILPFCLRTIGNHTNPSKNSIQTTNCTLNYYTKPCNTETLQSTITIKIAYMKYAAFYTRFGKSRAKHAKTSQTISSTCFNFAPLSTINDQKCVTKTRINTKDRQRNIRLLQ